MNTQQFRQTTAQCWYQQKQYGNSWVVYDNGEAIDIVWFSPKVSRREVRNSLVYQDGYPVTIEVRKPM